MLGPHFIYNGLTHPKSIAKSGENLICILLEFKSLFLLMFLQTLLEMIWPPKPTVPEGSQNLIFFFFIRKSLVMLGEWFSNLAEFWNHLKTLLIPGFHPWDTDLFDLGCSLGFVSFRRSFQNPAKMEEPLWHDLGTESRKAARPEDRGYNGS